MFWRGLEAAACRPRAANCNRLSVWHLRDARELASILHVRRPRDEEGMSMNPNHVHSPRAAGAGRRPSCRQDAWNCRGVGAEPAFNSFRPAAGPLAVTLLAVLLGLPACATMRYGTEQHVMVESQPPGATVFVGATPVGVTPTEVALQRDALRSKLTFCKDGFQPVEARFERTLSKWLWADVAMATWTGIISGQGVARTEQQFLAFASMLALTVGTRFRFGSSTARAAHGARDAPPPTSRRMRPAW